MQAAAAVRHPGLFPASPGRPARHRRAPSIVRMALREDGPSVAIAVGQEFLRAISLRFIASERSAGKRLAFEDREYTVQDLAAPGAFDGADIALFSAGGSVSRKYGPAAVASGAVGVDNSSAFRMDHEVPLVIPEVNPEAMRNVRLEQGAIVANPNCSTIICLMSATPPHRHAKVLRMVVSTYQSASDAGAAAMEELKLQTQEVLEGKAPTCNIFKQQYAFNIFSHNAPVLENGYNEEEMKMVKETRKIWNDKDVKVTATWIRVPVMRARAESVNLQFKKPLDEYAFNIFSHNARVLENGYNEEEMRMVKEARNFWIDKDVKVTATCLWVPVMRAHAGSANPQFENLLDEGAQLCLDSGATNHMVGDPNILSNIRDAPAGSVATVADGRTLHITHVGDILIPGVFTIPCVSLVPGLKCALISVRQLTRSGVELGFSNNYVMLFVGNRLVGAADSEENRNNGLYMLRYLRMPIDVAAS